MTSPELLRFFNAEATEYLDAVEALLQGRDQVPNAGPFVAAARALRGSATMARVPRVADLALALERIANGLRDSEVEWTPALHDELRDTVGDLRTLVLSASNWTAADDQRALKRLASVRPYVPGEARRTTPSTPASSAAPVFIALQSSAIASDLDGFVANSGNRSLLSDVVNRLRSLRGIAGVADHPPLGEVADAVERALREVAPDALLGPRDLELLSAAAAVFRRASSDLRSRGRFDRSSAEVERFARAATGEASAADTERIVHIEDLFFSDGGPHVVQRGNASPAAPEARFTEEAVPRAEHLRRLVNEARTAAEPLSRERAQRDLREHLASMEHFARSFGAQQVAVYFGDIARHRALLEPAALDALDRGAQALLTWNTSLDELERRLAVLERSRFVTPRTAARPDAVQRAPSRGASGTALRELLENSLSRLQTLDEEPLSEPARLEDDTVVPIQSLMYRGRAALARAIEIRDALRSRGSPDPDALHELYEMLDLARAE